MELTSTCCYPYSSDRHYLWISFWGVMKLLITTCTLCFIYKLGLVFNVFFWSQNISKLACLHCFTARKQKGSPSTTKFIFFPAQHSGHRIHNLYIRYSLYNIIWSQPVSPEMTERDPGRSYFDPSVNLDMSKYFKCWQEISQKNAMNGNCWSLLVTFKSITHTAWGSFRYC